MIKKYLEENGITQTEFANMLGDCTQGAVQKWASGKLKVGTKRALQIDAHEGINLTKEQLRPDYWPPEN
jgi:transcriptional regulator with XRE-family HTH domain